MTDTPTLIAQVRAHRCVHDCDDGLCPSVPAALRLAEECERLQDCLGLTLSRASTAEGERDRLHREAATFCDRLQAAHKERNAAIARAEAAERERDALRAVLDGLAPHLDRLRASGLFTPDVNALLAADKDARAALAKIGGGK